MIGDTLSVIMNANDFARLQQDSIFKTLKGNWPHLQEQERIIQTIQPFDYGGYEVTSQGVLLNSSHPHFLVDTPQVDLKGDILSIITAHKENSFQWLLLLIPLIAICTGLYFYKKRQKTLWTRTKKILALARKTHHAEVQIEFIDRAFKFYVKNKWNRDLYCKTIPETIQICKQIPQLQNDMSWIEKFYTKVEAIKYAKSPSTDIENDSYEFEKMIYQLEKKK
jgi:hypothetical protein